MKKLFLFLALILPAFVFGQGETIRRPVSATNSTQLNGKDATFYMDTLNEQSAGGEKTFKDTVKISKAIRFSDGSIQTIAGNGVVNVSDSLKAGVTDSLLINTNALVVRTTGQVGIGIAIPTEKLEVFGSIFSSAGVNISPGTTAEGQIRILGSGYSASIALDGTAMFIGHTSPSRGFIIRTNNIERFKIDNNANIVFNETGVDANFRIRSNANVNAFFLDGLSGNIGIRTATPNASLDVRGLPGTVIGGFASGSMHVTSTATAVNSNAVLTGHSLFNTNTQLWYFGSTSSSNNDIAFINRQTGSIAFLSSNTTRMTIEAAGDVIFENQIQIKGGIPDAGKVLTSDAVGVARWEPIGGGDVEGQYSGLNSQTPTTTTPIVLTFESEEITEKGITHSTTVNPGEFTATIAKTYTWQIHPQWQKTSAAGIDTLDFFVELDTGGGFVKITRSNHKIIADSKSANVIFISTSIPMAIGDKVRFMFRSSNPPNLQTTFFAATSSVPATPSQALNVFSGN